MQEALYETTILRQFAGLNLERIPDAPQPAEKSPEVARFIADAARAPPLHKNMNFLIFKNYVFFMSCNNLIRILFSGKR